MEQGIAHSQKLQQETKKQRKRVQQNAAATGERQASHSECGANRRGASLQRQERFEGVEDLVVLDAVANV